MQQERNYTQYGKWIFKKYKHIYSDINVIYGTRHIIGLDNKINKLEEKLMLDYEEDTLSTTMQIIAVLVSIIILWTLLYLVHISDQDSKQEYNKKIAAVINECKTHKVVKTYTANRDMEFYVTLDNGKTYEVNKEDYGKFIDGQYCK